MLTIVLDWHVDPLIRGVYSIKTGKLQPLSGQLSFTVNPSSPHYEDYAQIALELLAEGIGVLNGNPDGVQVSVSAVLDEAAYRQALHCPDDPGLFINDFAYLRVGDQSKTHAKKFMEGTWYLWSK